MTVPVKEPLSSGPRSHEYSPKVPETSKVTSALAVGWVQTTNAMAAAIATKAGNRFNSIELCAHGKSLCPAIWSFPGQINKLNHAGQARGAFLDFNFRAVIVVVGRRNAGRTTLERPVSH